VHSVHAQFFAAGDARKKVVYKVKRLQDGGRFRRRGVEVWQGQNTTTDGEEDGNRKGEGCMLAMMVVGFAKEAEKGKGRDFPALEHAAKPLTDMTDFVPGKDEMQFVRTPYGPFVLSQRGTIVPIPRIIHAQSTHPLPSSLIAKIYFRSPHPITNPSSLAPALMYFTDMYLLDSAARIFDLNVGLDVPGDPIQDPGRKPDIDFLTTMNHTVHVHDLSVWRPDEWFWVEMENPWAKGGRTLGRSWVYTGRGELVATVIQEVSCL
jgi:acyl-CoA thioesterase-2